MRSRPVCEILGAEILDVDLRDPFGSAFAESLWSRLDRHHLLLFRGQHLSPEDQLRVLTVFGDVSRQGAAERSGDGDVSYISNARPEGRGGEGELRFHSDQSSLPNPVRVLSLYGVQVPTSGGETRYSSMVRAFEILPPEVKERIADLHVLHAYDYAAYFRRINRAASARQATGPQQVSAVHPLAFPHPRTGTISLYINELQSKRIVELDDTASEELLAELFSYTRRPDNIYEHQWREGDLIVWDNLALLHARNPWDTSEARTLQRVQVS